MENTTLSHAGKVVLIKSSLSGIPIYNMFGINIPNYIAKEVDNSNRKFF